MKLTCLLTHLAALSLLASCASTGRPSANVDAKTSAALTAMSDKLAAAKTVKVTARRTATSGYFLGDAMAENARITASVRRPDKFAAQLQTNRGSRSVVYDGRQLLLADHQAKTHAVTAAPPTFDQALRVWHESYGYLPPLAELLVSNPKSFLLDGVTKGSYGGVSVIEGETTEQFTFSQEGFAWSLWISSGSGLPKKIESTYPNGEGGAPLRLTAIIDRWDLDAPLPPSAFTVSEPRNSTSIEMIPLNQ